jgi:hypothetical protein
VLKGKAMEWINRAPTGFEFADAAFNRAISVKQSRVGFWPALKRVPG